MSHNKKLQFQALVEAHKTIYSEQLVDRLQLRCEYAAERARCWSSKSEIDAILEWLEASVEESAMIVEEVSLTDMEKWSFSEGSSTIRHDSKDFYEIIGVRVHSSKTREVSQGWDQPLVKQIGLNGGILGLIRKKIMGIPYYLVEAKAEPGNPNLVQLSPTLQATFANLNQVHGGNKPKFAEYFEQFVDDSVLNEGYTLLFKQWLPEDGGRLYKKCNLGVVINLDEEFELPLHNLQSHRWVTLHDLITLIERTNWVNPHVRSLICSL